MPYTAEHKQATRKRILESARRLFNAKGFAEVSIDEVMEQAGLMRGGFYRHFRDKSQLYAEAVRWFLCAEAPKLWQQKNRRGARAKNRSQRIVDAYFSLDHFSDRETCCPLLTLSADIRGLFCEYCERLGVRWTHSNHRNISVSHRRSVAKLDGFIGPKS